MNFKRDNCINAGNFIKSEGKRLKKDITIHNLESIIKRQDEIIKELKKERHTLETRKVVEKEHIIINSFEQALEHSDDLIEQYMRQADWTRVTFKETYSFLNHLIENNKLGLIDEALHYITEYQLDKFNVKKFDMTINMIEEFIEKQLQIGEFYIDGLESFFDKIEKLAYYQDDSFEEFLNEYNDKLNNIVKEILKYKNTVHFSTLLLRYNFILNNFDVAKENIKNIQKSLNFYEQIEMRDLFDLLYISTYFKMDERVFGIIQRNNLLQEKEYPEILVYNKYTNFITNKNFDFDLAIEEIRSLKGKMKTMTIRVKEKVLERMKENLEKNKRSIFDIKITKADEVILINENVEECPYDDETLMIKEIFISFYENDELKGYIKEKVLCCNKCNKVYINDKLRETISDKIGFLNFKIDDKFVKLAEKSSEKEISKENVGKYNNFLDHNYESRMDGTL